MAALNGQRLGLKTSLVRPIAIAGGAFVADLVLHRISGSPWITLGLYLGSLLAIWATDLAEQWEPYAQVRQKGVKRAGLGLPVLAGFGLVAVCVVSLDMLYPPGPRDVCERFAQANDISSRKALCTDGLWSTLSPLGLSAPMEFEFLDDAPAKAPMSGHLITFRHAFVEQGQILVMDGAFQLVRSGESWKIDEIFVTHDGRSPLPQPTPFRVLLGPNAPWMPADPFVAGQFPVKKPAGSLGKKADATPGMPVSRLWPLAGLLGKTKVPAAIAVAIGGLFACFRRTSPSAQTSSAGK